MNASSTVAIFVIIDLLAFMGMNSLLAAQKNNIPQISFGKYYFESSKTYDSVILLANVKPNVSVYCYNKSEWKKKNVVFYRNIIGYKAEIYDKDCFNKLKIVDEKGEVVYYRDFSKE